MEQNSKINLLLALRSFQNATLSEDEIALRIDQTDFEEANITLWSTDNDCGHLDNFVVYPKWIDGLGNEILGLIKEGTKEGGNQLVDLPNAKRALSTSAKEKIKNLAAATARLKKLKELAQNANLTIKEINDSLYI